jgi:hypothetical protein
MVRLVGVEPTRPVGQQILSLPRMPFRISERMDFQFRAEAFNALNKVNLGTPNRYVNTPQFGTHHGDDAGTRNAGERQAFILISREKRAAAKRGMP